MAKKTAYGSTKRLGARYGRTVKFKLGKIETEQHKKHKCPYCNYVAVKRKALGIWHCTKCNATFTNKAYTVSKLGPLAKPVEEEVIQIQQEQAMPEENAEVENTDNTEANTE